MRTWANAILSNPDMLHLGPSPPTTVGENVLANLGRIVIVDEAYVYRGVFPRIPRRHVLRRLRRLAAVYGAAPQFLRSRGDDREPGELATSLTGLQATVVSGDSAPRAERTIVLWNPPVTDEELNLQASALGEGARLLAELVGRGLRTPTSRRAAGRRSSSPLRAQPAGARVRGSPSPRIAPATRRPSDDIEQRLASDSRSASRATDALELGIDIGLLDCVISVGFPGTVASLRQQWGRAGRQGHGLAVLVASDDALDQYFMREPDALLGRVWRRRSSTREPARARRPRALSGLRGSHRRRRRATLGDEALERAAVLPELRQTAAGFTWTGRDYPAARLSLRSAGVDSVRRGGGAVLRPGHRRARACVFGRARGRGVPPSGEPYLVGQLDLDAGAALVEPFSGAWYTQAKKDTTTAIEETLVGGEQHGVDLSFGRVSVTEHVVAYQRKSTRDGAVLETLPLDLHGDVRDRGRVVRALGAGARRTRADAEAALLLHAAEHALIALLPLFAMCDRWDIGGLSTNVHFQTDAPTVFVYDGHPGGVGIAERGLEVFGTWVTDTAQLLEGCPCESGCPSCVQSPKCGNLNEMLDKAGALQLLRRISSA